MKARATLAVPLLALLISSCGQSDAQRREAESTPNRTTVKFMQDDNKEHAASSLRETAVLGGGCFWCIEAVYEQFDGVADVESGYAGGHTDNPDYEDVCSGETGHAEVARITFDPAVISFSDILDIFWQAHDPTTLNRQGADVGTQYRSIILTTDERQDSLARASMEKAQPDFSSPIVTEIVALERFYPAELHHQDYYRRNSRAPYCQVVIAPKLRKLGLKP